MVLPLARVAATQSPQTPHEKLFSFLSQKQINSVPNLKVNPASKIIAKESKLSDSDRLKL